MTVRPELTTRKVWKRPVESGNRKGMWNLSIHWWELIAAVHKAGHADLNAIRAAILENDGTISMIPKQN